MVCVETEILNDSPLAIHSAVINDLDLCHEGQDQGQGRSNPQLFKFLCQNKMYCSSLSIEKHLEIFVVTPQVFSTMTV